MGYNKRIFNLGNVAYRVSHMAESVDRENAEYKNIPKIPRSASSDANNESALGSILIRTILCLTIFSALMLMRNSTDMTVSVCYDAIKAWSVCNYSIPEEYGIEKFVSAIKSGDIQSVFYPSSYPAIRFPTKGEVSIHYGDKDENGSPCLGVIIEASEQNDIISSTEGVVRSVGKNDTLGNFIVIEGENNVKIVYGCCEDIIASEGDEVDTNTVLAKMAQGNDGKYYVYMEVQSADKVVDPEKCFANAA